MTKRESNILKCVAIMLMLCHHLFMYANWPDFYILSYGPLFSTPDLLAHFGKMGNACVSIFVFVTAYGTTVSYRHRDMEDGYALMENSAGRLIRLLVNFQFVYIIAFALCPLGGASWLSLYSPSRLENLAFAFFDFMGLSYLLDTPTYNSSWWYMSVAITLIFLLPWAIKLFRRYGPTALLAGTLLAYEMDPSYVLIHYLPCVFTGVALGEGEVLEKAAEWGRKAGALPGALLAALSGAAALGLMWRLPETDWYIKGLSEAAICCGLSLTTVLGLGKIPGVNRAAEFVGKHSMNMYFIHVFIFEVWFEEFTYSLNYPWLIFLFLFTSSLAASILIEKAKSLAHPERLAEAVSAKLCAGLRYRSAVRNP